MTTDLTSLVLSLQQEVELLRRSQGAFNAPGWNDLTDIDRRAKQALTAVNDLSQSFATKHDIASLRADIRAEVKAALLDAHERTQRGFDGTMTVVAEGDVAIEKTLRTEIEDTARSLQRDVERAEAAAAGTIKHAEAVLRGWARELGA